MTDIFSDSYPPSLWETPPPIPPPELPTGVEGFTVDAIKAWVDDHEDQAQTVLDSETARGDTARITLLDWLRGVLDANDDKDAPP